MQRCCFVGWRMIFIIKALSQLLYCTFLVLLGWQMLTGLSTHSDQGTGSPSRGNGPFFLVTVLCLNWKITGEIGQLGVSDHSAELNSNPLSTVATYIVMLVMVRYVRVISTGKVFSSFPEDGKILISDIVVATIWVQHTLWLRGNCT